MSKDQSEPIIFFYDPREAGMLYGTDIMFKRVTAEMLAYAPGNRWVPLKYGWAYNYSEACFIEDYDKSGEDIRWMVVGRVIPIWPKLLT